VREHQGDLVLALADVDAAITARPDDFLLQRAALRSRLGDGPGALADLRRAAALEDDAWSTYCLGLELLSSRLPEGSSHVQLAIDLGTAEYSDVLPEHRFVPAWNLAVYHAAVGDLPAARFWAERASHHRITAWMRRDAEMDLDNLALRRPQVADTCRVLRVELAMLGK
jgi:hypothetical protein